MTQASSSSNLFLADSLHSDCKDVLTKYPGAVAKQWAHGWHIEKDVKSMGLDDPVGFGVNEQQAWANAAVNCRKQEKV